MDYRTAIAYIVSRRQNEIIAAQSAYIEALRRDEKLKLADKRFNTLRLKAINDENVDENELAAAKNELDRLTAEAGVSFNEPPPHCSKCNDTGRKDGAICSCVINMIASAADYDGATFADSNLDVFGEDKKSAQAAYDYVRSWCEKFPDTKKLNILLLGGTGTGKTFLAECAASELKSRGYGVMFLTAFAFVNKMLLYHTSPVNEKLDHILPVLDCDLLVIDDLGTESLLKNVTVECLHNVLNERVKHGKHTLITTNLDDKGVSERYGERIASRLFDRRTTQGFALAQTDLRKKSK